MNQEIIDLKEQFTHTFFQVRKVISLFHTEVNAQMKPYGVSAAEVTLMKMVKENATDAINNITSRDIQSWLCISKGAVSKILSALEQKEYLKREMSPQNRRSLIITLTPSGLKVVGKLEGVANEMFIELIGQMGRENTERFISSASQFAEATKSILEMIQPNSNMKG